MHILWSPEPFSLPVTPIPKRQSATRLLMSQTPIYPSPPSCLQFQGFLSGQQHSLPLHSFINTGAEDRFNNSDLVLQADLPTEKLPTPEDILALVSKILAHVWYGTLPFTLLLSGNHHESLQFFLLSLQNKATWDQLSY